jgi:hypothetical protein
MAITVNTDLDCHVTNHTGETMWRMNTLSISLIVVGALAYTTGLPFSPWGQPAEAEPETTVITVPVDVSSIQFMGASDPGPKPIPIKVDVVVPAYIIVESGSNPWGTESQHAGIHISVRTMAGSYSEHVTSHFPEQQDQLVSLVRSRGHGPLTTSLLDSATTK